MKKSFKLKWTVIFSILFFMGAFTMETSASSFVANLAKLKGSVAVKRMKNRQSAEITGREGLILKEGDLVITRKNASVSIIFRDGSEVRLFQNTEFRIEAVKETKKRTFKNNFFMKLGSIWGSFIKGRQNTQIRTPSATIGIKGTTLNISERNNESSVSLSSGLIGIKNIDHEMDLEPGKMVKGIQRTGTIEDKVKEIPVRLSIKADKTKLQFKNGTNEKVRLTIQLVNKNTGSNISKKGPVQFSSDMGNRIKFPQNVALNQNGYAFVEVDVPAPGDEEYQTGQSKLIAFLDGEEFAEIGSGQVTLTFDIPKKKRTIRINMDSGEASN